MKAKLIKERNYYDLYRINEDGKKVTFASTQDYKQKLSKQNCDEIFGVVDVDKWVKEKVDNRFNETDGYHKVVYVEGLVEGFNKAMELHKDKVFTLEDIRKAYYVGYEDGKSGATFFQQLIQSLQQPTEIEVEIEMENYGYCEGCRKAGMWHCAHADTCGYAETRERPKLDSEGYLILKKI